MSKQPTILVCPMDWGLGHATRVVPIIDRLLERNVRVILGADNKPLEFLRRRFPQCESVKIPGYKPLYQKKGSLALKVTADIPQMLIESRKAHALLEQIIDDMGIDAVISDNRYELWSDRIPTIFMTHQLKILTQGILSSVRPAIQKVLYSFIVKHNEVWVPDFQGEPNLSGELSHVKKLPLKMVLYIGPMSRFQSLREIPLSKDKPDVLCIMSGPEPQRSILEDMFIEQAEKTDYKTTILSGRPGESSVVKKGNVKIRSHSDDEEMVALIRSADLVISRSGYTTIMDLAALGKKAVFIPTPGQPEQEYLAKELKKKGLFYSVSQKDFSLEKAFQEVNKYSGLDVQNDYAVLDQRLDTLIEKIQSR
ncbi:MAG: glycosyltransferase [Bacteroidales bacterium]|nr:glycosyltransferase [Bacteroidales bacterium]